MISLSLVTPAKKLFTDLPVEEVFVPSSRGEINILDGHGPLMATLDTGILRYKKPGASKLEQFAISWGYLEISADRVTILAETAEAPHEIDVVRARLAKETAEKNLSLMQRPDAEQKDFEKYQLKLRRAMVRLLLADESTDMAAAAEKRAETTH